MSYLFKDARKEDDGHADGFKAGIISGGAIHCVMDVVDTIDSDEEYRTECFGHGRKECDACAESYEGNPYGYLRANADEYEEAWSETFRAFRQRTPSGGHFYNGDIPKQVQTYRGITRATWDDGSVLMQSACGAVGHGLPEMHIVGNDHLRWHMAVI